MITLSPRLVELMGQPIKSAFVCVRIKTMRLTTYFSPIILQDGEYLSSDVIFNIDRPQLTSVVDRDLYTITLADSNMALASEFENGLNGASVEVNIGFVDMSTGEPETNHLLLIYKGVVESYKYDIDTAEAGEVTATIVCSNLMASLDDASPYYTSKQFVQQLSPGDTSYDQIYEGSGKVVLKWGKK
jgi:hypothetical protein